MKLSFKEDEIKASSEKKKKKLRKLTIRDILKDVLQVEEIGSWIDHLRG